MDGNQLTAKFIAETRWETLPDAVKKKAEAALDMAWHLEEVDSVRKLTEK